MAKHTEKELPAVTGVSAAERALAVLVAFRRGDGALSLAELAERTGLVKSTIMRLAVSLQRYRLIARMPDGSYRLDAETLRLGTAYQQAFSLADHVMPALERLADKTGETASFYVRNGEERLCLFRVESASRVRMHVQPGDARPMDKSAVAQVLRRYEAGPPGPDDDLPLFTSGVTDPHAAALAMPVFGIGESLMGALTISGPVSRLTAARAAEVKATLAEAAHKLTASCGGSPPRFSPARTQENPLVGVAMSFFAPPRRVETSVFTRLPDRFRNPRRTAWADANQGGLPIDCFLEGPSFDRQGRLYVTDIPYGRIFRVSIDGEWELVAEYDGWPNGLKIHRDGRIFITDYKRGLMLLDPANGAVTPFLETAASESFKGVNDLIFAPSGNLYFTDQGQTGMHDPTGRVWKLTPDGRLTCLLDTMPSPNGIVVDPEESFLLVAVTRANQIWRVPLPASGLITKVGVFAHLHGGPGGPDGLALDVGGNLLICHVGFGSVWRLSPVAEPLDRIVSCADAGTTNLAFGGPERCSLFITESRTGTLLRAELDTPGLPMFSHAE